MKTYDYWVAQNTGWSGGISWFDNYEGTRYRSREDAERCAKKFKKRLPDSKHRIIHRIIQEEHIEI